MKIDPHEYDADAYVGRALALAFCAAASACLVAGAIGFALGRWWL